METYRQKVEELLHSYKCKLVRKKNHLVWELPGGRKWVTPNTPSDSAAWQNNYTDLRLALGIRSTAKTQADFEHKKKEPYQPKHIRSHDFLGTKAERRLLSKAKNKLADEAPVVERKVFPLHGRLPTIKQRAYHAPGGRTEEGYTFSKEIVRNANLTYLLEGEGACKKFLDEVRTGIRTGTSLGETSQTQGENRMTLGNTKVVGNGNIESFLEVQRQRVRQCKQLVEDHQLRARVEEKVLEKMEEAYKLSIATNEELKNLFSANPQTLPVIKKVRVHRASDNSTRMRWKQPLREIIGTSPKPLTRHDLILALRESHPQATSKATSQAVVNGFKSGLLVEDLNGVIRLSSPITETHV